MERMNTRKPEELGDRLLYLVIACAMCIGIWCLTPWIIAQYDNDPKNRGTTGDMFGAVNALFSGLAFAGVIYTIYLQRNELALQREEMRRATEEQANQTELMQKQINSIVKNDDFNKFIKYMESEPRFVITQMFDDTERIQVHLVNYGKQACLLCIDPVGQLEFEDRYQIQFETLNPESQLTLFLKRTSETTDRKFRLRLRYQNIHNIRIDRVIEIDTANFSIIDVSNNFLDHLEIPDFYSRTGE